MASVNKINLCDNTQTKGAGATLTCDPIFLPAYADDVLLVTKCGLSGQVEATLQHSPDGVRWSNCQIKKIESSSGTASFGNEWHLDTIPKSGSEKKTKHLLQYSNFGGSATDDVTTTFMAHNKPFNLSMWLKSTEVPATAPPGFSNEKAFTRSTNDVNDFAYNEHGTSTETHGAAGSGNMFLDDWLVQRTKATDSFSISIWFKITGTPASSTPYALIGSGATYGYNRGFLWIKEDSGVHKVGCSAGNATVWHTPASSVDVADGNWHHYVMSWDGTANSPIETTSSNTNNAYMGHLGSTSYAVNLKCYIDGEICAYHYNDDYGILAVRNFGNYNSTMGGPDPRYRFISTRAASTDTYSTSTTPNNYGWGLGYMRAASGADVIDANYDEFSFHDIELTATQVGELYNSGVPTRLDNDDWTAGTWTTANCLCWWRMFEGDNDSNTAIESVAIGPNGDGTVPLFDWDSTAEAYVTSSPARTVTPTLKIKGGTGSEVVTLSASDSIYQALTYETTYGPIIFRCGGKTGTAPNEDFGQGITLSLTDKVKTDGTWNVEGGENPHLLLSFDGFENDAAQWVAWKCSQTDIDPTGTVTPANLLDGTWHNLILSYRGVSSAGDTANFGRGGSGGHDNAHWHLGWNGLKTDHLNTNHGVDAAKSAANGQNVTLAMQDYHLKNVSDTYVRTSLFASGFLEDSVDSRYAFQGQIDETSFDSSTWWRNPIPEDGTFCDCPLEVVYGINDQRESPPSGAANTNYAFTALSLAPGKPHSLIDPLSVNTDPINNKKAYIDPFPTGQYRCSDGIDAHSTKAICDANHSVHDSPKGTGDGTAGNTNWIGANENFVGGIEWYYRWGDIATDCKVCVNDARAFTLGVSAGEPAVAETVTDRSAAIKGSLTVTDLKASVSSNSGGAETIYVEGSSGGGGTTTTYEDLVNDCVAAGDNVITHLNIPHLHHLRLVYTGSSACSAGDCIGDLFYSTRRKG